jgi:hypothetical protein
MTNDSAGPGTSLDPRYLKLWDPQLNGWVSTPVTTADGTYRGLEVDCAGICADPLAVLDDIFVVAALTTRTVFTIQFTPKYNFVGTAAPIRYEIRDMYNNVADSTYTPTIETERVLSLAKTGPQRLDGTIQFAAWILVLGVGMIALSRRRRKG